jgi:hypothetical protein
MKPIEEPTMRIATVIFVFVTSIAALTGHGGRVLAATPPTNEIGSGIASKYWNDVDIADDPAVLFSEDFESGDLKKWQEKKGSAALSAEAPHTGRGCVAMPMIRGKNTGGHLVRWFLPGAEKVYARFYVKFSANYQYAHHFVWLLANPAHERWRAFGRAGQKPDGSYFSTGMEPWFGWGKNGPPGEVCLYSYYPDMTIDAKMNQYWGNQFFPPGPGKGQSAAATRVIPPLGRWHCWEFMIQANTAPERADGKQAMWVDGQPAGQFTGLRWRTAMDLKINTLWLEHYGYDSGDPTKRYWKDQQTVWFDDVVVATQYIGPMRPR